MIKEFSICVILYNPTIKNLEHLKALVNSKSNLYIFDNSVNSHEIELNSYLKNSQYQYMHAPENLGISKAYNRVANLAWNDGARFLLCLDQDSYISAENLDEFFQITTAIMDSNVGLVALNTGYSVLLNSNYKGFSELSFAITSGSILNLSVFLKLNGFDDNLFIDGVDRDYCITLLENNYKILQVSNITMLHTLGEGKANLLGVYEHSPLRNYYIHRNRLYVVNKHPATFKGLKRFISIDLSTLKQIISIICFEKLKKQKLTMMVKAKRDFKNEKFGRYN